MADKNQKIAVNSYVYLGEHPVSFGELNEAQKKRVAIGLRTTYLRNLFPGKAEFSLPPTFQVGTNREGRIICEAATTADEI